jgi:hypothetical protein
VLVKEEKFEKPHFQAHRLMGGTREHNPTERTLITTSCSHSNLVGKKGHAFETLILMDRGRGGGKT